MTEETMFLSDVKEQKSIVPATSNVRMRIAKAGVMDNAKKDGSTVASIRSLKLELRIVDGITSIDAETGVEEVKYKNKPMFTGLMDLPYGCDSAVKTAKWWASKQYLVNFKKLCVALEIDLKSIAIDKDGVVDITPILELLVDREVIVDIRHEENQVRSPEGEYIGDGTFKERLVNWRKA